MFKVGARGSHVVFPYSATSQYWYAEEWRQTISLIVYAISAVQDRQGGDKSAGWAPALLRRC
nr:MAG TPA_asm: hypothetical protein [Caudoviricetes sp.]